MTAPVGKSAVGTTARQYPIRVALETIVRLGL
jgi:hypothetical protein